MAGPTRVLAGAGTSGACTDTNPITGFNGHYNQGDDIPLIGGTYGVGGPSAPAVLGAEISYDQGYHVALCYSTSPVASTQSEVTGGTISVDAQTPTSGAVWSNLPGNKVNVWCNPETNAQVVSASCSAVSNPSYTVTPATPPATGDTITLTVPFSFCVGTTLTGPSTCGSGAPSLGATGLIVSSLGVGGGPGGTAQGVSVAPGGTLYVDGISVPLSMLQTGAGVNVTAGAGPATPVCVVICTSVPSEWVSVPAGPTLLGVITVAGTQINVPNVLTSPACVSTPGAKCP